LALSKVAIDKLIQLVTQEVVTQLKAKGVTVTFDSCQVGNGIANIIAGNHDSIVRRSERVDMGKYKTPILTEKQINRLHELTGKIIVPLGTLITPKAREIAKRKQIIIEIE
jgi:hypothetical protein